jgi:hypothetical protein
MVIKLILTVLRVIHRSAYAHCIEIGEKMILVIKVYWMEDVSSFKTTTANELINIDEIVYLLDYSEPSNL